MKEKSSTIERRYNVRWLLVFYDVLIFGAVFGVGA